MLLSQSLLEVFLAAQIQKYLEFIAAHSLPCEHLQKLSDLLEYISEQHLK